MKTGVLVHGCNLNIENWRSVAWGEPPDRLGRIPKGILIAHEYRADVIVFGTGASKKEFKYTDSDQTPPVLSEAEFSFEFLKSHFHLLSRFPALQQHVPWLTDREAYDARREELLARVQLDEAARNTREEIENAGRIFVQAGCQRVILVSSPSHIVRCLRDAAAIFHRQQEFAPFRDHFLAAPSITCYEGTEPDDVVVVEPPHRPDRHVVPTHRRIQRMMLLQRLPHEKVVELIERFDDLLQEYEDIFFAGDDAPHA